MKVTFQADAIRLNAIGKMVEHLFNTGCDYLKFYSSQYETFDARSREFMERVASRDIELDGLPRGESLSDFLSDKEIIGAQTLMSFQGDAVLFPKAAKLSRITKELACHFIPQCRNVFYSMKDYESLARMTGPVTLELSEEKGHDEEVLRMILHASRISNFPDGARDLGVEETLFAAKVLPINPNHFDAKEKFYDELSGYLEVAWVEMLESSKALEIKKIENMEKAKEERKKESIM